MSAAEQDQTIVALEQKTVIFMDDELIAVRAEDGHVYVSVSHLSDALGLDRQGQTQRIQRQPVLFDGFRKGGIQTPGGVQTAGLIRVDLVPLWLAGINTGRIKEEERREKLERYQREAAKVLWEAFQEGRLTTDVEFDELLSQSSSDAVEAYRMLQAMVKLARNQIMLETQLDSQRVRLQDHEERLEQLEVTLGDPKHHITPEQASRLSQAVKAVAHELGKRSKKNEYGGVYGELYRRYGINSYKELPADKFEDAMNWLNEWLQSLIDDVAF
jgi:hypothetical protein